ncbi:YecA/YgfB family protein [Thiobacillus sedimenti]|uniref:YecA family protein n=1 Tax=Thiobacillus sedimenti TaxID=3110231 RepID=A0ABZ1CGP0_9PROT|nr:YecA family protein [Thiobacillus sp. SCUT-2]WRS38534.1 YecA family protein [Thiobacillus sp. SCUT-2]
MSARPVSPSASTPLSDAEIDELADLVDLIDERTDVPVSLEGLDGFLLALACSPRTIPPAEFFPVLLERADGIDAVFEDEADAARFLALFERRRGEIARALAAPIENLADPRALSPLIMDWQGLLADLPPAEARRLEDAGIPPYAQLWAGGFLLAVEHWESEWELPAGSKDEAFVDEMLDPFYILAAPLDELSTEERAVRREDHVALAVWGAYELREFWLDRGQGVRA